MITFILIALATTALGAPLIARDPDPQGPYTTTITYSKVARVTPGIVTEIVENGQGGGRIKYVSTMITEYANYKTETRTVSPSAAQGTPGPDGDAVLSAIANQAPVTYD